ncbi:hypothetical protein O3G_MSEX013461 [Manduca sexta]|uniref:Regulatory protein zeste n=1 Tax=Manduca sexta TaxID=7130 RepID=A0A921ZRR1_MANSE|nr:hypothetical protein O3G_MSEX013461 [Manduca sexta]KAG6462782.1 hypothetical protein O3G_MSEX013461 [Manduca sexta]KAG6462783.1 hypothetical protein O3G_MSEX013461 [Manduca sexta]
MQNQRVKASSAQLKYLFDFMKANQECFAGRGSGLLGKLEIERQWQQLTETLNGMGGPVKSVDKWKQTWRDVRNSLRKKATKYKKEVKWDTPGGTGNGPSRLNSAETRNLRVTAAPPAVPNKQKDKEINLCAEASNSTSDPLDKPRIIFRKLVKEKLATAESKRELIKEELEERKLRKQILREELQNKRELHELEKKERLLRLEILRTELRNKRN